MFELHLIFGHVHPGALYRMSQTCTELLDIVASLSSCLHCRKSAPDDGGEYFACVRGFPKA